MFSGPLSLSLGVPSKDLAEWRSVEKTHLHIYPSQLYICNKTGGHMSNNLSGGDSNQRNIAWVQIDFSVCKTGIK